MKMIAEAAETFICSREHDGEILYVTDKVDGVWLEERQVSKARLLSRDEAKDYSDWATAQGSEVRLRPTPWKEQSDYDDRP